MRKTYIIDKSMIGLDGKPRVYDNIHPCVTGRLHKEPTIIVQIERVDRVNESNTIAKSREEQRLGCLSGGTGGNFAGQVFEKNGLAPTLTDMQGGGRQPHIVEVKKMDQQIVAMRGRNTDNPSDGTPGTPTEQRLELNEQGICNTLTSVAKDNLVFEIKKGVDERYHNFLYEIDGDIYLIRIRKLTPRECWRLMAFTDEDYEKAAKVNSPTQLYKQAGNSIVCKVLEGIFGKMING